VVSPAYASAQLLEGREPDPRDDVYGLACTAYELLTGVHPFGYRSAIQARQQRLTVGRDEKLSYGQWRALCAALAFERAERTASAKEFLQEFNAASWRIRPSQVALGAVACLLAAIGGVFDVLYGPGTGSTGAGTITESKSKPAPTKAPVAEIASADAALTPKPAPAISPLTPIQRTPSPTMKPTTKAVMSGAPDPIASLLARAKRQTAAKQLTTPLGDAALESYREVLKRMPGHKGAVEGIARIKDEYTRWAQADKRRGRWKSAEASLNKALAIDPEDARLRVALRELAAARERAEQQLAREELRAHPIERAPAEASLEKQGPSD
jgi:eukaryotic-like serine/threonine-protein kinase